LKRIQSTKEANREEINLDFVAKNTNSNTNNDHLEEKIRELETEKKDVTQKFNKLGSELNFKSKELSVLRRKLINMKEALDRIKILITNHEDFKVGKLTDLEVVQKIEELLYNLDGKVKEQEAELNKKVPVIHTEVDTGTQPGEISFQDDQGPEERESYVSNILTHQNERSFNISGENSFGLKVTILSIASIHPNWKTESTIPASVPGGAGSTQNTAGLKRRWRKLKMARITRNQS
jgi:hypothetical protein